VIKIKPLLEVLKATRYAGVITKSLGLARPLVVYPIVEKDNDVYIDI